MSTGSEAVMKQLKFGDLILTFTDQFEHIWNDRGSGAPRDGAFWKPKPPAGFFVLGDVGVPNYNNLNGNAAALCVKAADDAPTPPLRSPIDYIPIWNDQGSGADADGACWRPVPPSGYVACGDIFVKGYGKPTRSDVMCVRADLAHAAEVRALIWNDQGSGANQDFAAYEIVTPAVYLDSEKGLFAAGTFAGNSRYAPPQEAPVVRCLNLPFYLETFPDPKPPRLTSTNPPPAMTDPTVNRVVYVPFTALNDKSRSLAWKVQNSPFYRVQREIAYKVELFDYNQTTQEQWMVESVKTGVSKSVSETFSVNTGISVTAENGVRFLGSGGMVSATISVELGWQRATGITEFEEWALEKAIAVPPGKVVALWAASYSLRIKRQDDSSLPSTLSFENDCFVHSEYPNGSTFVEHPPKRVRLEE